MTRQARNLKSRRSGTFLLAKWTAIEAASQRSSPPLDHYGYGRGWLLGRAARSSSRRPPPGADPVVQAAWRFSPELDMGGQHPEATPSAAGGEQRLRRGGGAADPEPASPGPPGWRRRGFGRRRPR